MLAVSAAAALALKANIKLMAKDSEDRNANHDQRPEAPEPPVGWRYGTSEKHDELNDTRPTNLDNMPNMQGANPQQLPFSPSENQGSANIPPQNPAPMPPTLPMQLVSARKYVTAAQICAIVSLFIGGILLSSVSVVVAIIAYRKLADYARSASIDDLHRKILVRPGLIAIAMCVFALALNVVSIIALYPYIEQIMQTGDYSSLFGTGGGQAPNAGSATSTWG